MALATGLIGAASVVVALAGGGEPRVWRCVDEQGGVVFSDKWCGGEEHRAAVTIKPWPVDGEAATWYGVVMEERGE